MRKKILLVDDSETILMIERMVLAKSYDIITAKDGQEAVEKAIKEHPNLILLDVIMPKMNGFQACKKLRAEECTSQVPIIMVTTRGEEENIQSGFDSGCSDYLTKPINNLELLEKVKTYIGE